jgi:glycosyltransferase involved in cell wall biosynthesis
LTLHNELGTFHRHVSKYLTLTAFAKDLLERDGIPASKITIKPNFVPDPAGSGRAFVSDEKPYVAFVGRLIEVKGIRTLLNAWPQVRANGLRLKIAGDGELRAMVEAQAREDPSIELLGWLAEEKVTQLMASAECVVVPSEWYEGQPLVTLRSLSVGTPVLVSDLENLSREVLDDRAGVAFRVGDAQSLARELNRLLADESGRRSLGERARVSYERRFSPDVNLALLENVYKEVTSHTTH